MRHKARSVNVLSRNWSSLLPLMPGSRGHMGGIFLPPTTTLAGSTTPRNNGTCRFEYSRRKSHAHRGLEIGPPPSLEIPILPTLILPSKNCRPPTPLTTFSSERCRRCRWEVGRRRVPSTSASFLCFRPPTKSVFFLFSWII